MNVKFRGKNGAKNELSYRLWRPPMRCRKNLYQIKLIVPNFKLNKSVIGFKSYPRVCRCSSQVYFHLFSFHSISFLFLFFFNLIFILFYLYVIPIFLEDHYHLFSNCFKKCFKFNFAKISPKPQFQFGTEVVIFPINPTSNPPTQIKLKLA